MERQVNDTTKAIHFLMIDSTDHRTGKIGLTPTVTILKEGGSFISPSGTVSEKGNGWYKLTPAVTDVDTLGTLILHAESPTADPTDVYEQVVAYNPNDVVRLGLTSLPNVVVSGTDGLKDVNMRVVLSAGQPDYAPSLQSTLLSVSGNVATILGKTNNLPSDPTSDAIIHSYLNLLQTHIDAISGAVWNNSIRTLTQSVTIDPSTRVVLSASQPDYNVAKEISATSNKNEVLSSISTRLPTSGYSAPDNTTIANIAISASAIKERTDRLPDSPANEISATSNRNTILSSILSLPSNVEIVLSNTHGSGYWDAISNSPVVLSASQPYYQPAIAGDAMTLTPSLSASIIKHGDLIDGTNIDYILEATLAMVNGNFSVSGDTLTLYKRDNVTPFSIINKTATTRVRVS